MGSRGLLATFPQPKFLVARIAARAVYSPKSFCKNSTEFFRVFQPFALASLASFLWNDFHLPSQSSREEMILVITC